MIMDGNASAFILKPEVIYSMFPSGCKTVKSLFNMHTHKDWQHKHSLPVQLLFIPKLLV